MKANVHRLVRDSLMYRTIMTTTTMAMPVNNEPSSSPRRLRSLQCSRTQNQMQLVMLHHVHKGRVRRVLEDDRASDRSRSPRTRQRQ